MFLKKAKLTKLFFVTDIHGSEKCWRKLVGAGSFYDVDTLILGGDITGKGTLVILEEKPGLWVTDFLGQRVQAETEEELKTLEGRTRNAGFYPYRLGPDEFKEYAASPEYQDQVFKKVVTQTVQGWVELAEAKLRGTGRRIIVTAGNDDPHFVDDLFQHSEVILWAERRVIQLDDAHEMLNEGASHPTPWNTHREMDEDSLFKVLKEQADQVKDPHSAIFNIHAPPYGSKLDDAPRLDSTLRPVDGGQTTVPVGSTATLKIIEAYQPLIGLHGHIHESKGAVNIGRTLCLNPGSAYGEGVLSGYLINLDKKGIRAYQPVQG